MDSAISMSACASAGLHVQPSHSRAAAMAASTVHSGSSSMGSNPSVSADLTASQYAAQSGAGSTVPSS